MTVADRKLSLLLAPALACALLLAGHIASAEAKVRATVGGKILTARGGKGADRVTVVCSAQGQVKVNGKDPRTGPIACAAVSEVDVFSGGGNDRVNVAGVGIATGFGQRDIPGFGTGTGAAAQLGRGNDRYAGGASAFNLAIGGAGSDRLSGGGLRDDLQGGAANDAINGGGGRDVVLGNGGADKLRGGADDDLLSGNAGNDLLNGGDGADLLGGGLGMDTLLGGAGDDDLIGGPQKDRLNGGPGNNTVAQDAPK
jgi:Ca2+-binding RTX toxin-like protein